MTDVTITANGTNNIYSLYGQNITYSTARTVYVGTNSGTSLLIGQVTGGEIKYVYRGTPVFDTSSLSGYTITSAILKFTGSIDVSTTDFDIQARGFTESTLASNSASFTGYGSTSFGSINTSNFSSTPDNMTITFNSSGLSYLNNNISENCCIMLVSSRDMSETSPFGDEAVRIRSGESSTSDSKPHLYLEYIESTNIYPQIRIF